MKTCSFCNTKNSETNKECVGCGAQLIGSAVGSKMECKSCGANLSSDDKFCTFCGTSFLIEEKPDKKQVKTWEFNRIAVDPKASSDRIAVSWDWTDYIFTAALNTSRFFSGCPKCGNEIYCQLTNSDFTCSKCGHKYTATESRVVGRPLFPFVRKLTITNKGDKKADFQVTAYVEPDLSDKWTKNIDGLQPDATTVIENEIDPKIKIQKIDSTPLRANLHLDISSEGRIVWTDTQEIKILPRNQMMWSDEKGNQYTEILRCFVTPNEASIGEVIARSKPHLKNLVGSANFSGYQPPNTLLQQVEAIYMALKYDYSISYNNCPPTLFQVGFSQTFLLPRETLHSRAGNCVELTNLFCSCIERLGIDPVVFLVERHAFPGFFMEDSCWNKCSWERGVSRSFTQINELLNAGLLVPFEATGITNMSFQEAMGSIFSDKQINPLSFRAVINLRYLRELEDFNFAPLSLGKK